MAYNRTFKVPSGRPPLRSPSPPHAHVEPLSPIRPRPVEPSFNYPPLARPPIAVGSTDGSAPVRHHYGSDHESRHRRASSTIDTLADVALHAGQPYPPAYDRKKGVETNGYGHGMTMRHYLPHDGDEPPHKRARSELLPSPHFGQAASQSGTSYMAQPTPAYDSRVEEAALLLNFQSGGWPKYQSPELSSALPRPHANSFPQDGHYARPIEALRQTSLMPPFESHAHHQAWAAMPPPQDARPALPSMTQGHRHSIAALPMPNGHFEQYKAARGLPQLVEDAAFISHLPQPRSQRTGGSSDGHVETHMAVEVRPVQVSNVLDETALDVETSASATPAPVVVPKKRGWPKGKPRGSGARKTVAEKAATKRTSRKKAADGKGRKVKKQDQLDQWADHFVRRKSLSDMDFGGENGRKEELTRRGQRALSVPRDVRMIIREVSPSKSGRRKPVSAPETVCASCAIAREATNSRGELDEWICCNGCKKWFHIDCAGFKKAHEVRDVDKYFCTPCEPDHGKTTYVRKSSRAHASVDYAELQRGVLKTSEESVEHHYIQPIKDGTFEFDPELFPRMRPEMVTKEFFERSGAFTEPICIPAEWNPRPWGDAERCTTHVTGIDSDENVPGMEVVETAEEKPRILLNQHPDDFEYDALIDHGQDRLEMVMPEDLTVRQVCDLVGADTPLDVIDVKTQNSGAKWTLGRWADYYEEQTEEKAIRNVISLEVSQTRLGRLLQRPKIVRDIDLQDDVWPQEEKERGKWPKVQFYCLMSVADSYTDFHIDFGGSSVYYHILRGKKTFFFIPPKAKHLKAYEEWNDSPQQNYTFLPHITKECYRVDLSQGDTMLIPSGWIHAVWTPSDSLVIGGNFLNRMAYKNQFKVVDIEKANETPMKFRYPFFQKLMWYTAIKYLRDDALPQPVRELFFDGKRFERDQPVWADFDGSIAAADGRVGAHNARYYSQAEIDGLPELVNFIFRTVMLVTGRLEGITQDRIRRVNASIPKGHGDPLDIAKAFALWVAWKRGNEDPPAWAHPDAVLPNTREEGPPKKLSERKLKELERREAIAAYRVAPDRQSSRVMSKNAAANSATAPVDATPDLHTPAPPNSAHHHHHQFHALPVTPQHEIDSTSNLHAHVGAFVMPDMSAGGQHLSTPKTSVLGPKRVACDACRKRRIRCKHKDVVVQTSPEGPQQMNGVVFHPGIAPELHTGVTPPRPTDHLVNFVHHTVDGQPDRQSLVNSHGPLMHASHIDHLNDRTPQPGTNAYVHANIPMAVNGIAVFGEGPKRGRTKACYECRKSKRRCVHDESGNVDPVKAAETPVPRASIFVNHRKRSFGEGDDSLPALKKQRSPDDTSTFDPQLQTQLFANAHDAPKPSANGSAYTANLKFVHSTGPSQLHSSHQHQHSPPQIDPSLFSMYSPPDSHSTSGTQPPYNQPSPLQLPSLEEIANEVLVDLTDPQQVRVQAIKTRPTEASPPPTNGYAKTEQSVDSAVSMPTPPEAEQDLPISRSTTGDLPSAQPSSAEASDSHGPPSAHGTLRRGAELLPLYCPPPPARVAIQGGTHRPSVRVSPSDELHPSPPPQTLVKRPQPSCTPGAKSKANKPTQSNGTGHQSNSMSEEERQSFELARLLQQEDLGLRRRSK